MSVGMYLCIFVTPWIRVIHDVTIPNNGQLPNYRNARADQLLSWFLSRCFPLGRRVLLETLSNLLKGKKEFTVV